MANVEREDNMLNEEQESSQSNSSNGSSSVVQPSSFQLKSSVLRQSTFGGSSFLGGGGSSSSNSISSSPSPSLTGSVGGGASLGNSFNLKPSVLKPSQLSFGGIGGTKEGNGAAAADKNGSDAVAPATTNPFLKTQPSEDEPADAGEAKDSTPDSSRAEKDGDASANSNSNSVDPLAKLKSASLPKSNLFANVKKSTLSEASCGFVFGQNVHERVTGENLNNSAGALPTTGFSFATSVATGTAADGAAGGAGNATATVAPAATGTTPGKDGSSDSSDGSSREPKDRESLEEAARRYEESRGALKRKYEEVETITGEEDERNVVEINCKLFAFAKSNWEERGHGTLRLNDKDNNESRVVFRQSGNLRVLINTKVWSGMVAEQPSQKSLRLTAIDSTGQIKVFLVMSRPEVVTKLHRELSKRIETAKQVAEFEAAKENKDDNKPSSVPVGGASIDGGEEDGSTLPVPVDIDSNADTDEPSTKKRASITSSPPSS